MKHKERPILEDLILDNTTEIEKFQNETIRPIIKLQHPILIALFRDYLVKRKTKFDTFTQDQQKSRIKSIFTKDINFKNLNIGVILGQFNMKEYLLYQENSSEYKRRILQIIVQRIQDSLSEL